MVRLRRKSAAASDQPSMKIVTVKFGEGVQGEQMGIEYVFLWGFGFSVRAEECVCVFYLAPSEGWEPSISKNIKQKRHL